MYICSMYFVYPYLRSDDDFDITHSIQWVRASFPEAVIATVGDKVTGADMHLSHKKRFSERGCDVTDKILTFAKAHLNEQFIYLNDDFFIGPNLNPDITIHSGEMAVNPYHAPHYQKGCYNTSQFLKHNGFNTLNFECHQPMQMDSRMLIELFKQIEWKEHNHFIKSLYGNVYQVPSKLGQNLKLNQPNLQLASQLLSDYGSFSIGDGFKTPQGLQFLKR